MLSKGPVVRHGDKLLADIRVALSMRAMCQPSPRTQRKMRSLSYSGFFLASSGVLSVWAAHRLGAGDVSDVIALRILAYACWLYGLFGMWTLLGPGALETVGLGGLRGYSRSAVVSGFLRLGTYLTKGVAFAGLPGLMLAALLTSDEATRAARLTVLGWSGVYIAVFAVSLATLGALSRGFSARRARLIFAMVLLLPYSLELSGMQVPNVLGGLMWAMGALIQRGAS